jgi:hypothetical protein
MTPGASIVAGVVGLVVAAGLARLAWVWWRRFRIPWEPLPGAPGVRWYSQAKGLDWARVLGALRVAESALARHVSHWTPRQVRAVADEVRIYVVATESWLNLGGKPVAGEQLLEVLYVGPSLAALCHELAHRCEEVLDKRADYAHAGWTENGIRAALAEYDAWLGSSATRLGISPVRPLGEDICWRAKTKG